MRRNTSLNIWLSLRPTRRAVSAFWRKRKRSGFGRNKTWRFAECTFPYNSPSLKSSFVLNSRCGWLENVVQCALAPSSTNRATGFSFLQQIRNRNKSGRDWLSRIIVFLRLEWVYFQFLVYSYLLFSSMRISVWLDDAYNKVWFSEINRENLHLFELTFCGNAGIKGTRKGVK